MNSGFLVSLGVIGVLAAGAVPAPVEPAARPVCRTNVVAGDADNGSSVCVVLGSDVSILLTTVTGSTWSAPTGSGRVLGPAMPLPTPFGRVGWQFRTLAAGHAEIRTSRPGCAPPAAACPDVVYRLHVTVR
jgi:hypothetical protein